MGDKIKKSFEARIKEGFIKEDFITAITNCMNDPYHKENPKYLTPEFICRNEKLEKFRNIKPVIKTEDVPIKKQLTYGELMELEMKGEKRL